MSSAISQEVRDLVLGAVTRPPLSMVSQSCGAIMRVVQLCWDGKPEDEVEQAVKPFCGGTSGVTIAPFLRQNTPERYHDLFGR